MANEQVAVAVTLSDAEWWKTQFQGVDTEAGVPLFRVRSKVYARKSRTATVSIDDALRSRLAAATGGHSVRLFELAAGAMAGVLFRYRSVGETERIVIGAPGQVESSALGAVPLLIDVDPAISFNELVRRASSAVAEGYARGAADVSALSEWAGVEPVTHRCPLFGVAVQVRGYHAALPDLRHDVTLTIGLEPDSQVELEYNANVQDGEAVARFGEHVVRFLRGGLARPDGDVIGSEYLGGAEKAEILGRWAGEVAAGGPQPCIHELVECQAAATPAAEALIYGDEVITYAQMNARANQLAHYLERKGVRRGSRVAISHSPTPSMLIGVLGILKTGACVVPLVPTFPVARNAMTVTDAVVEVVVTESALRDRLEEGGPARVYLDLEADAISRQDTVNPTSGVNEDDLVYILFTSGSTGRPKGVALQHRTLSNLVQWQRRRGADPAGARTLQRTSIGFDVSFQEIFATLGYGGCLVVGSEELRDDVSLIPESIERYGIARVFLPPVALEQLAASAATQSHSLASLREIIVAGEQLHVSLALRRFFRHGRCTLDNHYGPTETHVVTAHALEGPSSRWPQLPPIGRPIANVRIYILDTRQQPVPAGVPGELWVGGIAPARGYLTAHDTEAKFRPDPFVSTHGRMYRTGDICRFLADGTIEFIGRRDHQVKLRGYRIELGDVEAALLDTPNVRQAAVDLRDTPTLGKQLVAWVVPDAPGADAGAIRRSMLERLPGHMVPSLGGIVFVDALRMTATGKIDRKALPFVAGGAAGAAQTSVRGNTEPIVATLWAKALGVPQVGRDQDFLELGGHSLVAIQLVSELNETFGVTLPLRSLLRGSTVATLAAAIDGLRGGSAETPLREETASASPLEEMTLPGGLRVRSRQRVETEYLFRDIFEHRTYDRGGIVYPARGRVFDVGAHIGLFTLFARSKSPELEIFAFEPCPPLFEALRLNTDALRAVHLFPYALADIPGAAELTYYPNVTGMSSFRPDGAQERALLAGILRNLTQLGGESSNDLLAASPEYMAERFVSSTFRCERKTVSEMIRETGIEQLDLLKIDVQKTELEVLQGVATEDWPKIRQVIVEAHDVDGRLDAITALLAGQGYRIHVEQDALHSGTAVHFVYATV